jgi:HSP20 family protein
MAVPVRRSTQPSPVAQRWDPFQELEELHSRLEGIVQSALPGTTGNGALWTPPVDIEETDDEWIVEADLPGAKQADINVEARGNEVVVSGEIKERERKGILRRRTRRTGEFELRVTIPGEAGSDKVDASLDHGVLTVRIPKPEQAKPRRIEVQSTDGDQSTEGQAQDAA